jgi:hypothetical protein
MAVLRFAEARRRAKRQQMLAWLSGRDNRLMPFEVIRRNLRQQSPFYRGVRDVPLDKIVGSVGRYHDLTRHFLPLTDSMRERWVQIDTLVDRGGWPPVELYKVGDVYFVRDGNHRLSVARHLQMGSVEAHVWEFPEEIQIGPEDTLDEVLIRFRARDFMAQTQLARRFPDLQIQLTIPGGHSEMLAQIEELRHKLIIIDEQDVSFSEAVEAWVELLYLPTIQIIQDSTLLDNFPGRTEADLFVWLSAYRTQLQAVYGNYELLSDLAQVLAQRFHEGPVRRMTRRVKRLLGRSQSSELPYFASAHGETNFGLASDGEDELR